jgi:MFS superfamily sulfate permease-like transporter
MDTPPRGPTGPDVLASVVVVLVALPLCMGIAIASGVPPAVGIVGGIIGGIVVGALSGSPLQVSGPAAGLVVIVTELIHEWGALALGPAVVVAGGLQILAGRLRVGRWFRSTSPAVIHGMMAGIGVLLVLSQAQVMLDLTPAARGLDNLLRLPSAVQHLWAPQAQSTVRWAGLVGLVTLATQLAWERGRPAGLRLVPGPLVGVIAGTVCAHLLPVTPALVQIPASLLDSLDVPGWRAWVLLLQPSFWAVAAALALIASAESLLSASAVDRMHDGPRTRYDRELVAQGVGNALSGLVGGLPLTGVIVRSSANIQAGGRSRWATILHGVWLAVIAVAIPGVLARIPLCTLAAVLVLTGARLAAPTHLLALWRESRWEGFLLGLTALLVVVEDLLLGVGVGLALMAGRLLLQLARMRVVVQPRDGRVLVRLAGAVTVVSLPQLSDALEALPRDQPIDIDLLGTTFLDHASIELLQHWVQRARQRGTEVTLDEDRLMEVFRSSRGSTTGLPGGAAHR